MLDRSQMLIARLGTSWETYLEEGVERGEIAYKIDEETWRAIDGSWGICLLGIRQKQVSEELSWSLSFSKVNEIARRIYIQK